MNKNLKRALNTTAAVSMSLAMVLGAVAPVTNIAAANATVETAIDNKSKVEDVLNMLGDVTAIAIDEELGEFKLATGNDTDEFSFAELVAEYQDLFEEAYKYASVVGYTEEQTDALAHLVGTKIDEETKTVVGWAEELISQDIVDALNERPNKVNPDVVETYDLISALLAYKGNVQTNTLTTKVALSDTVETDDPQEVLEFVEDKFADLEADVKDYKEDNVGSDAKKFAKEFASEVIVTITLGTERIEVTPDYLVNDEGAIPYTSLTTVENFIKKVTKDTYVPGSCGVKYGDVKEEDVVADYIEGLEAVVAEMKEAKELIADTKDEKKAFDGLKKKLTALVRAINGTYAEEDDQLDAIDNAIADFRAKDIEALKAYVDTVVNEFWTVAVDQRTSGSYRVKEVDAGLGRYYAFEDVADNGLYTLMTTLVDRDEEETYYDVLVADAASVDELLKAVTTDIEGMTMNTVMTNQQAAKIIAAKKALTKIDANSEVEQSGGTTKDLSIYTNDLTRSERAEVDANREMIEVLYVKLLLNGEVKTVGWVETAQGWEYYDNNGKRVMEGWAPGNGYWSYMKNGYSVANDWCAAKEGWYYMGADGKMVTGIVTIDGVDYNFGTDGIWVR